MAYTNTFNPARPEKTGRADKTGHNKGQQGEETCLGGYCYYGEGRGGGGGGGGALRCRSRLGGGGQEHTFC